MADAPQIYSVVTAGMRHTCALTTAGSIECWGVTTGDSSDYDNDHGQVSAAVEAFVAGVHADVQKFFADEETYSGDAAIKAVGDVLRQMLQ